MSFPTQVDKNGTAKSIWTKETAMSAEINCDDLPKLSSEMKEILEGLAEKKGLGIGGSGRGKKAVIEQFFLEAVYLGDWACVKKNTTAKKENLTKEQKEVLKARKKKFVEELEENKKGNWSESDSNWAKVDGAYGKVYCDDKLKCADGKHYEPYYQDFDEAMLKKLIARPLRRLQWDIR